MDTLDFSHDFNGFFFFFWNIFLFSLLEIIFLQKMSLTFADGPKAHLDLCHCRIATSDVITCGPRGQVNSATQCTCWKRFMWYVAHFRHQQWATYLHGINLFVFILHLFLLFLTTFHAFVFFTLIIFIFFGWLIWCTQPKLC